MEAYINWPLIDDTLAIRGVFYNAVEGGYIDNVYGENAYTANDVGFVITSYSIHYTKLYDRRTLTVEETYNAVLDGFKTMIEPLAALVASYNFV